MEKSFSDRASDAIEGLATIIRDMVAEKQGYQAALDNLYYAVKDGDSTKIKIALRAAKPLTIPTAQKAINYGDSTLIQPCNPTKQFGLASRKD